MALHLYGVVRARELRDIDGSGVDDAPLRLVVEDTLVAVVSDVPDRPPRPSHANLTAHIAVLEQLLELGAVVPLRFGQRAPDDADVRRKLLGRNGPRLHQLLDEIAGRVELRLKAVYDEAAILRRIRAENPRIARMQAAQAGAGDGAGMDARIALGEEVLENIDTHRQADAQRILDAIDPVVEDVVAGPASADLTVVDVSVLLERARLDEFDELLEAVAAPLADDMAFSLAGPLPPMSFVDLTEEQA